MAHCPEIVVSERHSAGVVSHNTDLEIWRGVSSHKGSIYNI